MSRTLIIAKKLLSWKKRFQITDETGAVLYECTWKWGWPARSWVLCRNGEEVAIFRRNFFAFSSIWLVRAGGCDFRLREKLFTFRRHLLVDGGPYDGAELTGGLLDRDFKLVRAGETLAHAHAKVFTVRQYHAIQLLNVAPEAELLTALLMANLLVQKHDEADMRVASDTNVEMTHGHQ